MANRKSFLVRIDPVVLDAVRRWADDDLRSMNGQVEFILRKALKDSGRLKTESSADKKNGRASRSERQNDSHANGD